MRLYTVPLMLILSAVLGSAPLKFAHPHQDSAQSRASAQSQQAADIATVQALTRLQDRMDSIDAKLGDLKENTKELLDANNRSVDILKDLLIAILSVVIAILGAFGAVFFQVQQMRAEMSGLSYLPRIKKSSYEILDKQTLDELLQRVVKEREHHG